MGVHLMTNFNYPYFSRSVGEFWKRWHISLSTWFRDYLYIPLGGNRVALPRQTFNTFMVFMISGIWHCAGWTFVIWGFLHGLAVSVELMTKKWRKAFFERWPNWLHNLFSVTGVFLFVQFVWIFFRAESFSKAWSVIKGFGHYVPFGSFFQQLTAALKYSLVVGFFMMFNLLVMEYFMKNEKFRNKFEQRSLLKWGFYVYLVLLFIFFGSFKNAQSFIYFQF
jgi:D-alanyl-lipoteichoic acid acyltransferase DltB (MBOAT superfamily)